MATQTQNVKQAQRGARQKRTKMGKAQLIRAVGQKRRSR